MRASLNKHLTGLGVAAILTSLTVSTVGTAAVAAPTVASVAPAAAPVVALSGDVTPDAYELEVLRLTNQARAKSRKCGSKRMKKAKPVRWSAVLAMSAHGHSADMATRNYFSHYTPEGVSPFARIRAVGYNYRKAGENIAAGRSYAQANAVVNAWLKSPGHCKILMHRSFKELGVGRVEGAGKYTVYWTQNFGKAKTVKTRKSR